MRKTVLAMFLALIALVGVSVQAAAMDGFDLGDMPPLPPPLLDDSPAPSPVTPPASGLASPLSQGSALTPPPSFGGTDTGSDLSTPLPPPLAPPPIVDTPSVPPLGSPSTTGSAGDLALPPVSGDGTTAPAVPVVLNETPRNGRIEGGRVNVRAGPNTQYESIAVLGSGSPITVLAKHEEWYKIVFPADQLASIHKSNVTADITGEIPEAGLPGVVNIDNANVHAFYWDKSTVVGHLNQGDPVVIKQERGQWYRIVPPENARAYVFAQYVRVDGAVVADAAPAPENPSVDLAAGTGAPGEIKLSEGDKQVNAIKEAYFKRIQDQYEAEREREEAEVERRIKELTEKQRAQASQLDNALKDLDARLSAIDEEKTERISYFTREYQPTVITGVGGAGWAPPDPAGGGYTGWMENIGRVGGAPSSFRLTKGGEIRFYLRSDRINLNDFVNRRVWMNGPIEPAGGASASVLNVDQIRVLTELEIAEDMRQMAGQPYQPAPTYADPYAGATVVQPAQGYVDPYAGGGSYGYADGGASGYVDPYAPGGNYALPDRVGTADIAIPVPSGGGVMTSQPVYGAPMSYDNYTASSSASIVPTPTPGTVYNGGPAFGEPGSVMPQMPSGGPVPSDPSQLPDVVGAGGYIGGSGASAPIVVDTTLQGSPGEVDSDFYERPVIQEIAP